MIDENSMLQIILDKVSPLPAVTVPLSDALHRFAANDVFAEADAPAFANSFYDGYAVTDSGRSKGTRLRVDGEQPAGRDRKLDVKDGSCVRIFTGAPIPKNTAAIVMQEDTLTEGETIIVQDSVPRFFGIRPQGTDVCRGQKILTRGQRFTPPVLGLLASQGMARASVTRLPRISILATGNEIRKAGEPKAEGEIYESNGPMLSALFQEMAQERPEVTLVEDSLENLRSKIRESSQSCDVLLICGGMSVGKYDFAPAALEAEGFQIEAHRVRIKPGKPFLFGTREKCVVFGFPGNPVSAYITALLFARPAVLCLAGAGLDTVALPASLARLREPAENAGDRPHYLRGRLENGDFSFSDLQESHALFSLARSNALLRIPENGSLRAGEIVSVLLTP